MCRAAVYSFIWAVLIGWKDETRYLRHFAQLQAGRLVAVWFFDVVTAVECCGNDAGYGDSELGLIAIRSTYFHRLICYFFYSFSRANLRGQRHFLDLKYE